MASQDKPEVLSAGAGLAATVAAETHGELGEHEEIRARGYWEQVWLRFKRDKAAIGGGLYIIFLILAAFGGAPLAAKLLGHGPNDQFIGSALDEKSFLPVGPWHHIIADPTGSCVSHCPHTLFILGADSELGRDEFLRLLYGAQVSLEVAVGATLVSMFTGVLLGATAGYFGGRADTIISRLTEIVMAFPFLLFVIALASTVGQRLNNITLGGLFGKGVLTLVFVIGLFSWFYPARIVRAQVLSLREKEFVEAARMVGASDLRIIRSHLLPHLVAPIIVYSTLIVAQNILFEAGLSFLDVGIPLPTASWGNLLETAPRYYTAQPWLMLWPGLAVLLATLAFNLLGDGLRDAVDPRSSH
ncbi:MAG: ABC transporter permease [Actinomycetota bacterium]|nr:ABC transporter permease [Actinomycetota bacterium]